LTESLWKTQKHSTPYLFGATALGIVTLGLTTLVTISLIATLSITTFIMVS
jgi:hypothetical protein